MKLTIYKCASDLLKENHDFLERHNRSIVSSYVDYL